MLHEGNPDSTNIKAHFKYNHDPPPPREPVAPATTTEIKSEEQPRENAEMSNGIASVEEQPTYVNGTGTASSAPPDHPGAEAEEETIPAISEATSTAPEDTEMEGVS